MAEADKDQRTEDATPRRREEAREKGQVAFSQEVVAALMTCASLVALSLGGGSLVQRLGELVRGVVLKLGDGSRLALDVPDAAAALRGSVTAVLSAVTGVLVPVLAVGAVVAYGQVGFRLAPGAVALDLTKLDPVKGMQRLFSLRSWVRTGLSALKIVAIAACVVAVALYRLPDVVRMGSSELGPTLRGVGHVVSESMAAGVLAMLVLAVLDLIFQRRQHDKDLRMTKEEVREEHRTTEGDPHVRARIRSIQRETARRRMMSEIPKATVVVTNPDHYAVALAYPRDPAGEPLYAAPRVVAKGADELAQRIKQVARDADVPLFEDVPLARSLYAKCDLGDEIPEDLFTAVAAVLNYVYGLRGRRVAA